MFENIRLVVGLLLFIGLGINFFYQGIRAMMALHKNNYSKETIHTFQCRECKETYQLDGEEARTRISLWSTKLNKRTPKGQTQALRFECPECHTKTFQYRVFDTDVTGLLGNVRAQFDESSRGILMDVLLKGFVPILVAMPLLGLLLP